MKQLTLTGALLFGLIIGGKKYTSFTMREADVGDMMDAEGDVGPGTIIAFNTALGARQLKEVSGPDGTYTGPFTIDMLKTLKSKDYRALRDVQDRLDQLGNDEPSADGATSILSS